MAISVRITTDSAFRRNFPSNHSGVISKGGGTVVLNKATKKNMIDAVYEALTTRATLEEIAQKRGYNPFRITKSQIKFLIHNLDYIAIERIADLTDDALLKVKQKLGKRFTDMISKEEAQQVLNRIGGEYKKITGRVGDRLKRR